MNYMTQEEYADIQSIIKMTIDSLDEATLYEKILFETFADTLLANLKASGYEVHKNTKSSVKIDGNYPPDYEAGVK